MLQRSQGGSTFPGGAVCHDFYSFKDSASFNRKSRAREGSAHSAQSKKKVHEHFSSPHGQKKIRYSYFQGCQTKSRGTQSLGTLSTPPQAGGSWAVGHMQMIRWTQPRDGLLDSEA